MRISIQPARCEGDFAAAVELFEEYAAWLGVDLNFQGYVSELANLPAKYAQPAGELYLAWDENETPVGCVGVAPLPEPDACEMKRLYVRKAARGTGTGRALAETIVRFAEAAGYRRILLDSLPTMVPALTIYRSLGFKPIAPYYTNPVPGALFFCKQIRDE